MKQTAAFLFADKVEIEDLGDGISRQILGFNQQVMMVKVMFATGAVGYMHDHFHSQVTYVESGLFEITIGDETQQLKAGDCYYMKPNIKHGAKCLEAGVLIDSFSPCREDFLAET
ncbi:MAG: cupin domain-containing protein [Thalassotalea sp.]